MAAPSAPQGGGMMSDPIIGKVVIFGIAAILTPIFYDAAKADINRVLITLNIGLLYPIQWFGSAEAETLIRGLRERNPATLDWANISSLFAYTGNYYRWLIAPVFLVLALYVFSTAVAFRFSRVLTLKDLAREQAKAYPFMQPIVGLNLEKIPRYHPHHPWRSVDCAITLAVRHGCLVTQDGARATNATFGFLRKVGGYNWIPNEKARYDRKLVRFDPKASRAAFEAQLGGVFHGVQHLNPYQKGIAAALLTFAHRNREGAFAILDRMAISVTKPLEAFTNDPQNPKTRQALIDSIDLTGVDEALARYADSPEWIDAQGPHGKWLHVWFYRLREYALHNAGILENAHYAWLRPIDRELYYTLLQVPHRGCSSLPNPEASGVRAHYEAERELGNTIEEPEVATAVKKLHDVMIKEGWLLKPKGFD